MSFRTKNNKSSVKYCYFNDSASQIRFFGFLTDLFKLAILSRTP